MGQYCLFKSIYERWQVWNAKSQEYLELKKFFNKKWYDLYEIGKNTIMVYI